MERGICTDDRPPLCGKSVPRAERHQERNEDVVRWLTVEDQSGRSFFTEVRLDVPD